ncbi:hypothetical protein QBC32DRAFT_403529 [Pseudoneurospora amorphoporcata]|uniref:Uncharacterized protein n=1 Tax=Pseudoneurospora amorphoporcata TaxID=241081 RepID=A0AAN6P015_9PEZI|nr:hypothetical protein QBC32DRAFT_403529 [Pseudoneurospora amorphoporcata]
MSRLLTRLPGTIHPTAPLRISIISRRGIVTDLETGGTRKSKQSAGKGFISVGQKLQSGGMPTADKGDEPLSSASTRHTILPSLKHTVQQTMEHPEEWEGIHAERIASKDTKSAKAVAHPEEWEGIRAEADASDGWEAGRAGRDTARTSEFPGVSSKAKSSRGRAGKATSGSGRGGKSEKESSAGSNSPDNASPKDAHRARDLGRATIPMDSSTGLGQQPIATAGGFSTADIREGSLPNLSVGGASIPSFTLETQPRPAPTAVNPFSTTSTSTFNTSTFTGSTSKSTPSTSSTSHSTSPDITASTGLSGRRTGPGAFAEQQKPKRKTQAQIDEELRMRMEDMAGEGGAAGVEYEDGKPVAMKRGVRENMFRYI